MSRGKLSISKMDNQVTAFWLQFSIDVLKLLFTWSIALSNLISSAATIHYNVDCAAKHSLFIASVDAVLWFPGMCLLSDVPKVIQYIPRHTLYNKYMLITIAAGLVVGDYHKWKPYNTGYASMNNTAGRLSANTIVTSHTL
jgi:hypothetical protein